MKTHLNDLFDRMEPEEGNKLDDKIDVEGVDLDFDYLIGVLNGMVSIYGIQEKQDYLRNKITDSYSSKQITKFSLLLNDDHLNKDKKHFIAGLLDFLMNKSEDKTHNIYTSHLSYKLDDLGFGLINKVMYIHGDVGDNLGDSMEESKIIVNGNAGYNAGFYMRSGEILVKGNCEIGVGRDMIDSLIEVEGNCGDKLATGMRGGKIIVKGNAGRAVGAHMAGGVVKIYGNIASLSYNIIRGDIYHKNKLIVKDGEILDNSYEVG